MTHKPIGRIYQFETPGPFNYRDTGNTRKTHPKHLSGSQKLYIRVHISPGPHSRSIAFPLRSLFIDLQSVLVAISSLAHRISAFHLAIP